MLILYTSVFSSVYEVGPGQEYANIGDGAVTRSKLNYWNQVSHIIKIGGTDTGNPIEGEISGFIDSAT